MYTDFDSTAIQCNQAERSCYSLTVKIIGISDQKHSKPVRRIIRVLANLTVEPERKLVTKVEFSIAYKHAFDDLC